MNPDEIKPPEKEAPPETPPEKTEFEAPKIISRPDHPPETSVPVAAKSYSTITKNLVAVTFHAAGKIYDFDAGDMELKAGDQVVVETEEGLAFAQVAIAPREENISEHDRPLKKVIRKTNYEDMRQHEKNKDREKRAYEVGKTKIREYQLPMKLVNVEYLHSGSKAIFYFISEDRVDFRKLVRDLAHEIHTRIEMRQIGPRDQTKIMGGIGICGRELCCTTWLRDFDPISIKMAKEQELSLNPSKLAGQCGRLKCCLAYEYESYIQLKKGLPKIGKKVCWKNGDPCGRIAGHNIFTSTLRVTLEDGTEKLIPASELQPANRAEPEPQG